MSRRRFPIGPPVVPDEVPPASIVRLPGRGEVFTRIGGEGEGPTLLLLHGWTASADLQWSTAYGALADGHRFVAVDHRGHGRGLRSEQPFSLEAAADDAAAVVRELGVGPVVCVGYSMGGPISLLFALRHPELCRGLVLEATSMEWLATPADRRAWRFLWLMERSLRSKVSSRFTRRFLLDCADTNPALAPRLAWLAAEMRRGDATAIIEAGRALAAYDARPFAASLGVPTSVVLTTRDRLVKPSKQRELATATAAEVFELHGDHDVFWAQGPAFAAATRRAVDSVVARLTAAEPLPVAQA